MRQIKESKKRGIDLLSALALLVLARICCPALSNIPIFSMAFTFIYGVAFFVFYLLSVSKIRSTDFYLLVAALAYALYVFLRGFAAGNGLFTREAFNAYIIVFLVAIYTWVREKPIETKVLLFKVMLAALFFDYVYSIIVLFFDPAASRTAAALGVLERSPYDVLNAVGSFDTVYGGLSVILILFCMRWILKENKIKNKTTLIILILAIVFIVMAAYGTSLVLLVVALALFFARKNRLFSALLLLFAILVLVLHEPVGQWVMDMSKNFAFSELVSEKMYDVGYMLKTFEAAGTYAGEAGRAERMTWSWEAFQSYPIFGGLGMPDAKVGGHSELLDLLGNFGFIGFFFAFVFFVCLYRNIRGELKSKEMVSVWKIMMLVFVASAVLNPSLYALQMMPMILMISLAPAYIEMCESKKKLRGEL